MTGIFVTVDTELSFGAFKRGVDLETNLVRSIFGGCAEGSFGVAHQAGRFNAHGLKAVFFVDPMPAALFGLDIVRRTIAPILEAGHEVQLHIHTEWLPHIAGSPVGDRRGTKMRDFDLGDQIRLVAFATDLLVAAGAPPPVAFRAGNYGADDRTLEALAANGIRYDSSFNAAYLGRECQIGLPAGHTGPAEHRRVIEAPVGTIPVGRGRVRHAQLCALSSWEMGSALRSAVRRGQRGFTIVLHSFELLSRDRLRANWINVDRFERLCALLAQMREHAPTASFAALPQPEAAPPAPDRSGGNVIRTAHRMGEQLLATWLYERSARPA